jgi:restriction system protein
MAVWLVRAGEKGEMQDFALENSMVVIGWDVMPDLSKFDTRSEMETSCQDLYPDAWTCSPDVRRVIAVVA